MASTALKSFAVIIVGGFLSAASCDDSSNSASNANSGLVSKTADMKGNWDVKLDDPAANKDDGKEHPREAAIKDPDADAASKRDAWNDRSARLAEEGEYGAADRAQQHADYWHCRSTSMLADNC
jgi:hypothetical protein